MPSLLLDLIMGLIMRPIRLIFFPLPLAIQSESLEQKAQFPTYPRRRPTESRRNLTGGFISEETMRLHSAITLRNLLTKKSLRIPQNLSITINSLGDVSSNLGPPSPSHYSKSSLSEASFSSLISRIPNTSSSTLENQRRFGTDSNGGGGSPVDVNKVVDEINLKFAEAREEIEMAMESKETVYFNEEAECARAAVTEVLEMFEGLLGKVTEKEKASLQRSMGLKMEQLKAELQQVNED